MTQEEKQLILVDLSARLPYHVKCEGITYADCNYESDKVTGILSEIHYYKFEFIYVFIGFMDECPLETVKPYLRPMSSMTEEEYKSVSWEGCSHTYNYSSESGFRFVEIKTFTLNILNWLNAHHFDYRGLIEKGLALEAPEDMYKEEQE